MTVGTTFWGAPSACAAARRSSPKRDTSRTDAILAAAAKLLLEVGYDRLRIQDVAARAGCGTGAIYRRWSTKQALVAETIRAMPDPEPVVTDDPVADLRTLVRKQCTEASEKPDLVPGLIAAMRADEGIARAVIGGAHMNHVRQTVARIVGDDHPHLSVLTEMTASIPLFRSVFQEGRVDIEATTEEIMSLVVSAANR